MAKKYQSVRTRREEDCSPNPLHWKHHHSSVTSFFL